MMITSCAYASWIAASSALIERTLSPVAVFVETAGAAPNAPNSTFANERFIALLISDREQEARRAVERAADDEDAVAEREARRRRGESAVRVEQRDDHRHVGAADRHHHQHAEQRASAIIA